MARASSPGERGSMPEKASRCLPSTTTVSRFVRPYFGGGLIGEQCKPPAVNAYDRQNPCAGAAMPGDLDADAQKDKGRGFGAAIAAWLEDIEESGRNEICNCLRRKPAKLLAMLRTLAKHRSERSCARKKLTGRLVSRHPLHDCQDHPPSQQSGLRLAQTPLLKFLAAVPQSKVAIQRVKTDCPCSSSKSISGRLAMRAWRTKSCSWIESRTMPEQWLHQNNAKSPISSLRASHGTCRPSVSSETRRFTPA